MGVSNKIITPADLEPFKLGSLQQALQVYNHLKKRKFTFDNLANYVYYATLFQKEAIEQDSRYAVKAANQTSTEKESPQRVPLTREERKKFRKRR